jgi:hypothetical protein
MQDLDRDLTVVPKILGEEHHGHAAAADLGLDGVPILQGRFETFQEVRHAALQRNEGSEINIRDMCLQRPSRHRGSHRSTLEEKGVTEIRPEGLAAAAGSIPSTPKARAGPPLGVRGPPGGRNDRRE